MYVLLKDETDEPTCWDSYFHVIVQLVCSIIPFIIFTIYYNMYIIEPIHMFEECGTLNVHGHEIVVWDEERFDEFLNREYEWYLTPYDELPTRLDKLGAQISLVLYHYGGYVLNSGVGCDILEQVGVLPWEYRHGVYEGIMVYHSREKDEYWHIMFMNIIGHNGYVTFGELLDD